MAQERDRMKYYTEEGQERRIWESSIARMKYVAENAPVGRLQIVGRPWATQEVRKMQDSGLWLVDWVEPGDEKREGGWIVTGLTEMGRNVLAQWRRREAKKTEAAQGE